MRGNFQKMPTKWNDAEILWGVQGVGGVEMKAMYSMASSYNMGTSFARETRSILRFGSGDATINRVHLPSTTWRRGRIDMSV